MDSVEMHLPVKVGDYTDFYSSIEHASNIGSMFRDPSNPLLPNWKHIPVGYHGRASSIIVSGTNIQRPKGQILPVNSETPIFSSSKRIDFELEMGYIIGKNTELGSSVSTSDAEDYIFGKVLFNDWSARDIQKWEYVPLGPFLGKSFASSISPWVVTLQALTPFKVKGPIQDPEVLDYLKFDGMKNYDINLSVSITPENSNIESVVCKSNFKFMYWNMIQQVAHHTVNGCNLNVGDMMASGTISGHNKDSYGSMLELSWGGKNPIELIDGSKRTFINDLDTITMRGYCEKNDIRVGFGEVKSKLLASK
jgi:fumarylacetoacetase